MKTYNWRKRQLIKAQLYAEIAERLCLHLFGEVTDEGCMLICKQMEDNKVFGMGKKWLRE